MSYEINRERFRQASAVVDRALGLAVRAAALADEIDALHEAIRTARDEPVRRAGFRCDSAIGLVRQASTELGDTVDLLERVSAALRPGSCPVPWGVCPEHGNTLTSAGRKTWCRAPGCGRIWPYDRVGLPCIEPAQWQVTDQHGAVTFMCDGHALDASKCLDGAQIKLREELA
jgi:hypothetical protein